MNERIYLDNLNQDSVSVKKQTYVEQDGQQYPIGQPWRRTYINSVEGRIQIVSELPQAQVNAILAIWGDTPAITEKTD